MLKVMIADDEPGHRIGLTRHINWNELGYEMPVQAEDAEEALEIFRTHPVDVLITDICMPGMDGIELIRQLRKQYPKLNVLIISGYEEFEFARCAVEAGAQAYILKPLKMEEISKWLKKFAAEINLHKQAVEAEKDMKKKLNNSLKIAREKFIEEMLKDNHFDENEIKHKLALIDLPICNFSYRIAVVSIDKYAVLMASDPKMGAILLHKVVNMIDNVFTDYETIVVKTCPSKIAVLILSLKDNEAIDNSLLETKFGEIQKALKIDNEASISVCISREGLQWDQVNTLFKDSSDSLGADKLSKTIENASKYLREHLEEDTTVKELSGIVHMNSSYLSVLFKKEMGETISDYVNKLRIEKAKELLQQDMKIYDIAKRVGYQNPSYFANQFKKVLGCTPADYRKRIT